MKYIQWLGFGILCLAMKVFISPKRFDSTLIFIFVGLLVVGIIVWYCYDSVIASRQENSASKRTDSPQVPQKDVPVVSHENVASGINSEYAKALKHYLSKNAEEYIHARSIFRQLAQDNDAKAMFIVGLFEEEGIGGFKVDPQQASEWYERARAQGDALATYMCLRNDETLDETSKREIVNRVLAVASQGDVFAQTIMGRMCAQGWGMEQNYAVAREWYANAIRQGDPLATYYDGVCEEAMDEFKFGGTSIVAYANFKRAADFYGLPKAQYQLGRISEQRNSMNDAVDYYIKAAAVEVEEAQIALGRIFDFSAAKQANNPFIIPYWNTAAAHGEPNAQGALGFCYYEGWNTTKDCKQAMEWWTLAAENGYKNPVAQFYMGLCYHKGNGVEKDEFKAAQWFYKSANQGIAEAQLNLACMYKDGIGVDQDNEKTMEWLEKAATGGLVPAQSMLGKLYLNDSVGKVDAAKAEQWLLKAAAGGDATSQLLLGIHYMVGDRSFKKDVPKAVELLTKVANKGVKEAQLALGQFYLSGDGTAVDYNKAAQWFERAASQGSAEAQLRLGLLCESGNGVTKDRDKAMQLFRQAAQQGSAEAQRVVGLKYLDGEIVEKNISQAVDWLTKAANQGDFGAQAKLGIMYGGGEGVERDAAKAVRWLLLAAEHGDKNVQTLVGGFYLAGDGVEQDLDEALRWFLKAAEQGDAEAQFHAALCYYNGHGTEKDMQKAMQFFAQAADQGHRKAQIALAGLYHDGIGGVEKDIDKAIALLRPSALEGNAAAQLAIGKCYLDSSYKGFDADQANYWLKKAADQGNSDAVKLLGRIEASKKQSAEIYSSFSKVVDEFQEDSKTMDDLPDIPDNGGDDDYFQFLGGIDYKEASETSSVVEEPSSDNPGTPISNDAGTKEKPPEGDAESVPTDDLLKSLDGFTDFLEDHADKGEKE